MPDLPTLTVTDAQAARMLAAYGSTAAYRAWLKQQIITYVIDKERQAALVSFRQQQDAADAQANIDLGGTPPPTDP